MISGCLLALGLLVSVLYPYVKKDTRVVKVSVFSTYPKEKKDDTTKQKTWEQKTEKQCSVIALCETERCKKDDILKSEWAITSAPKEVLKSKYSVDYAENDIVGSICGKDVGKANSESVNPKKDHFVFGLPKTLNEAPSKFWARAYVATIKDYKVILDNKYKPTVPFEIDFDKTYEDRALRVPVVKSTEPPQHVRPRRRFY